MKAIYNTNGLKVYPIKIEGYDCRLFEFKSGHYSIEVPFGDNEEDKKMFDKLVYFNQLTYNGASKKSVINKVSHWIKNYKEEVKHE